MNDRAIELYKQAGAKAYELCKERGHKVGEIDSIWVSIMAATLSDLIVKECIKKCEFIADQAAMTNNGEIARKTCATAESCAVMIKEHFGITE
jgi:ribosomal protein L12E/L44/L45/RPP1/RPP2